MALNTALLHPFRNLKLLTLALAAIIIGLWPHALFAQDAGQQVLQAINAARAENGLSPLAENSLLDQAAQNHVDDMLTNYIYGHYGSDGSTVQVRVARTGYSATPWVSENWVSASDASGAMRWWMNDYIHRVNILTSSWSEIGIGVGSRGSEMIFVTVFSAGGGSGNTSAVMAAAPPQEDPPPPSVHIEQVSVPPEGLDYTVEGGDTLLGIGLRYGLPWERIAESNNLTERSLLQIGQTIHIPGSGAAAIAKPKVKTEDYTIQANDTLWTIAAKRDMYWDDIADVNGFDEQTVLQIGQVIQVPVVEKPAEPILLVKTRHGGEGPMPANESPDQFNSYSLMQFDPTPQATNVSTLMVSTGIGGPVGDGQVVAMAKSQNIGATAQVIAQHEAEMEFEAAEAKISAPEATTTSAEATTASADVPTVSPDVTTVPASAEVKNSPAEATTASVEATTAKEEVSTASAEVTTASLEASTASADLSTLYEVEAGDTIISIAAKFNLEWGPLLTLNGLTEESVLQLGQVIRLR